MEPEIHESKWERLDPDGEVPMFARAYSDGYIDAMADAGMVDLRDRDAYPERDALRAAARRAIVALLMRQQGREN